ncbi:thioredoxin family protein [Fulvivirga sp. M361]|uniref:thioredoxin family protein n=1 Tax=Fulvivirga sp. M361 TaxID=2594266 RepID=UPI00117BA2CB|nr:thioredoxin family protein [Fulvivirga sp. M361]TRX47153.1 thioredoxin family protein [Fulvivirga sp. M361]
MKRLYITLVLALIGTLLSGQPQNVEVNYADGSSTLLGQTNVKRLKKKPFKYWYTQSHSAYSVNANTVSILANSMSELDSITIFMGTWCGDSKREVPRFYKILEQLKFDRTKVKLICVDRTFQNYKQSPGREEAGQNIHRVPTFILYKDSSEIGRIVESPLVSLEEDMLAILSANNYVPRYRAVSYLNKLFDLKEVRYALTNKDSLALVLKEKVDDQYELNTYAYCLFSSFKIPEAKLVYELNRDYAIGFQKMQ